MNNPVLEVLSVHTSNKCSIKCPFCYLDRTDLTNEKPHEWWVNFFNSINNVKQIALAWNEQPVEDICQYISIATQKNIIVNITCHPRMIDSETAIGLKRSGVTMVSVSLDRHKCKNIYEIKRAIDILKKNDILAGVNLLLDNDIVLNLEFIVHKILHFGADTVYSLHPKPDTLKVPLETLKSQLLNCSFLFGRKFSVDESSKMKIGKSSSCQRGKKLLSVNSSGEICLCSFDKGFKHFDGEIVQQEVETTHCPFL